jgi:surface carbohydrate biosynthesis protein
VNSGAPNLFLMIEVAQRELDSRLLLARKGLEAGYRIVIGQQWLMSEYLPQFRPGVVVYKGINRIQGGWMLRAKKFDHRIVAINEEVMALAMPSFIAKTTTTEILGLVDSLCTQGLNEQDTYRRFFPEASTRMVMTGNPRADLLTAGHRHCHFEDRDRIRAAHGRFILVNTNFGYINTEFGMPEDFLRHCAGVGMFNPSVERDIELFKARFQFERENMMAFNDLLPVLRERYPNRKVILRPHPAEDHGRWRSLVSGIDGVEVHGDGPAIPWILASDLLIHNACTTGVEALLLEHPAIAYCSFSNMFEDVFLANRVSTRLTSLEELLSGIDRVFQDPDAAAARQKADFAKQLSAHYRDAFDSAATDQVFAEIHKLMVTSGGGELLRPGETLDPDAPFPVQQKTRISLTREQLAARFELVSGQLPAGAALSVEQLGESLFSMRFSPREF